jgi:hypothetical protein
MVFDVELRIREVATGIRTEVALLLEVTPAESGLYIASNPMVSPLVAAGETPRDALLAYLGDMFYRTTVEAEMATSTHESEQ